MKITRSWLPFDIEITWSWLPSYDNRWDIFRDGFIVGVASMAATMNLLHRAGNSLVWMIIHLAVLALCGGVLLMTRKKLLNETIAHQLADKYYHIGEKKDDK